MRLATMPNHFTSSQHRKHADIKLDKNLSRRGASSSATPLCWQGKVTSIQGKQKTSTCNLQWGRQHSSLHNQAACDGPLNTSLKKLTAAAAVKSSQRHPRLNAEATVHQQRNQVARRAQRWPWVAATA